METKFCTKCNIEKPLSDFAKRKDSTDGRRNNCKDCINSVRSNKKYFYNYGNDYFKKHAKKYRENNPEKAKQNAKRYRDKNKEKEKARVNKFRLNNKELIAWRRLLTRALSILNGNKNNLRTIDLLGYSAIELKIHIEHLFTEGMTWDNYGEWHIDHIKPLNSFDKDTLPSIVNSLSNLRPLWATTKEINGIIYEGNLNRKKKG